MRHKVFGKKLNRNTNERKALFRNLVCCLIQHGQIMTTRAKAQAIRGLIDTAINRAKEKNLNSRRYLLSILPQAEIVDKLIEEVAPRFASRTSGFSRIIKIGPRKGDNAPMVMMELVEKAPKKEIKKTKGAKETEGTKEKETKKSKKVVKRVIRKGTKDEKHEKK